jgi:hypothetical protein
LTAEDVADKSTSTTEREQHLKEEIDVKNVIIKELTQQLNDMQ